MKWFFLLSLTLLIAGCRPCSEPDIVMPTFFVENVPERDEGEEVSLVDWWEQFDDPLLNELIEQALVTNRELRVARERICEARAFYGIEFSSLLPHADLVSFFDRMRNSQTLADSPFTGGTFTNFYQVGFDTLWEIDLFGKNLDKTRAAAYDVAATAEEVRDVHVTVASEVAVNYFLIRTLQKRIEIAEKHIKSESELLALVEERYEAGLISQLDVYTAKALLQERIAAVPQLTARLYQTIYALAVLIGEIPEALANTFCEQKPLPAIYGTFPLDMPSDLLCRRGDVRASEFAMRASGARVIAARKEFFPTISLESLYSYTTGFFTRWFDNQSRQWFFLPTLTLPIFHGGEILSHINVETSIQKQRVLEYEQSVLKALEEVESSLVGYFQEEIRIQALEEEVAAYREARELAQILYVGGVVDFLYVIDTERDLFISENLLAESQEQLLRSYVGVFKALGGGWECFE